jgi:NADH-quinone oxidoreductase subunit A
MSIGVIPIFVFAVASLGLPIAMLVLGVLLGPKRPGAVKQMPYESGMDPFHDARRRFDVRFHLVAIAFLIFDVELLFLYPWAVASRNPAGIDLAIRNQLIDGRAPVFGGVVFFAVLVTLGLVYEWRRGVLRWR